MIAFKLLYSSYKTKVSFKRHKTVPTIFTSLLLLFSLMPNELMLHLTHTLLGTETIWIWYSYLPILLVLLIFFVAINLVFINFKGSAVTCPTTWTVTFFFICRVLLFQGKKISMSINHWKPIEIYSMWQINITLSNFRLIASCLSCLNFWGSPWEGDNRKERNISTSHPCFSKKNKTTNECNEYF